MQKPLKYVLLGITGGVAAYKAAELTRLLIKAGYHVEVVMTEAATRFVTPRTFQALSGHPVYTCQWDTGHDNAMAHINLSRHADVFLIAPATADTLSKIAQGSCDNLLTSLVAARSCPLIVAPAMNCQMWENPPNQRNIATLRADGVTVFGPEHGEQACGEIGEGRMMAPETIVELLYGFFRPKLLAGKRVLLTAGPTYEAIDPVRGITNLSSGKMGYALARACRDAGATVTLISGPTALAAPAVLTRINVTSAAAMQQAVFDHVPHSDIFIAVAAVADYHVKNRTTHKHKKADGPPQLQLEENPDILRQVAAQPSAPFCVGFAAESRDLLDHAEHKRRDKKLPVLVANLAQNAMGADDNEVVILDKHGAHALPVMSKQQVAEAIVNHLATLLPH